MLFATFWSWTLWTPLISIYFNPSMCQQFCFSRPYQFATLQCIGLHVTGPWSPAPGRSCHSSPHEAWESAWRSCRHAPPVRWQRAATWRIPGLVGSGWGVKFNRLTKQAGWIDGDPSPKWSPKLKEMTLPKDPALGIILMADCHWDCHILSLLGVWASESGVGLVSLSSIDSAPCLWRCSRDLPPSVCNLWAVATVAYIHAMNGLPTANHWNPSRAHWSANRATTATSSWS